jgi:hypothetical protein
MEVDQSMRDEEEEEDWTDSKAKYLSLTPAWMSRQTSIRKEVEDSKGQTIPIP